MATVTNTIKLPDGTAPAYAAVEIELIAATNGGAAGWINASDITVLAVARPTVTAGAWSASLTPNDDIDPADTVYRVNEYVDRTRYVHYIDVGSGGGTVHDLLVDPPASLATAALTSHITDSTGAHAASAVSFTPAGTIAATDTQTAVAEVATEAASALAARAGDRTQTAGTVGRVGIVAGHASNAIASDLEAVSVLGGGQTSRENVVGAASTANVNTANSNLPTTTGTGADYSVIVGGYDNVANGLMSVVTGAHNYTATGTSHGTISGGSVNRVTAGDYGTIAGGTNNQVSGSSGAVGGGQQNVASGSGTFVAGGSVNTASGDNASVIGGATNTASEDYAVVVGGGNNTASGFNAGILGGANCTASKYHSAAIGQYAVTTLPSGLTIGGGRTTATGDSQSTVATLRRQTTNATPGEMRAGLPTERLTLPNDSTWAFEALIVARRADADGESAAWRVEGCIDRNGAANTTALVGSPTVTVLGDDSTGTWTATALADTTNGALQLRIVGEAAKTINWVAQLRLAEVTG